MIRYVWRVGELASLSPGEVSALTAPVIQRYLTGSLTEECCRKSSHRRNGLGTETR